MERERESEIFGQKERDQIDLERIKRKKEETQMMVIKRRRLNRR